MARGGSADKGGGAARRPRAVYGVGEEPDVRFSLANERTALAWVRTGLALVAGGVALTTVSALAELTEVLYAVAILASLAGAAVAVGALVSWRRNERALRLGQPLPAPVALGWLVAGVVVVGLALGVLALVEVLTR